jgi:hypothetical protein
MGRENTDNENTDLKKKRMRKSGFNPFFHQSVFSPPVIRVLYPYVRSIHSPNICRIEITSQV